MVIDTPEAVRALEAAFREAEERGPWRSRIDVSELFKNGSMLIELDEDGNLLTASGEAEKKA